MKTKNPIRFILSIAVLLFIIIGWNSASANSSNLQTGDSILHVKPEENGDCSSWDDACDLQFALSLAEAGDQVWVATGTYKPTTDTDRLATFQMKSGVAIYGGFAGTETNLAERDWETNLTTLSGDIGTLDDSADNSYHVVTGSGVDETAILDGFTITAGNANGGTPHNLGGGMYNPSGSPTLINDTFSNNSANYGGGGIYNDNYGSPTLINVTFSSNSATINGGEIYNNYYSSPTLIDVSFSNNTASNNGGGMYNLSYSSPNLSNVIFSANTALVDGGGMVNGSYSSPTLTNVSFSGNSATYWAGGMYNYVNANPILNNVTFDTNSAENGAGMLNDRSNPTLTNVTFSNNTASENGGGMSNSSSSPALTNVTFSGNTALWRGGGMNNWYYAGTMTHVTFSGNTAVLGGGGIYNVRSEPIVISGILWANEPQQILNGSYSSTTVTYSVVQGGFTGEGNIDADPLLGSLADNGGFTQTHALGAESPAVDAADPVSCPAFDQRYYFRPIDGDESGSAACDMGAYEYGSYELEFSLAVDEVGEGTATVDPVEETYHFGDMVTLTATASPGWSFSGWSGDASGTLNPLFFMITANSSITATFIKDEYTLTVAVKPLEKGSVSIDPVKDTYDYGDEVILTAVAIPGWYFTGWSGGASGTDNPLTITIEGDTSITVNFLEYFKIYLPLILRN